MSFNRRNTTHIPRDYKGIFQPDQPHQTLTTCFFTYSLQFVHQTKGHKYLLKGAISGNVLFLDLMNETNHC